MKGFAIVAAAAALIALAGCDRLGIGGGNVAANDSANASTNAAGGDKDGTNSAAAAPAASGGKDGGSAVPAASNDGGGAVTLDRAYVSGRWTDDGNCGAAVEFTNDGRFVAANGNEGLWNLQGDRLTMQGERTLTLQIVPIDQNTMTVVNPDGSLGRSTRC